MTQECHLGGAAGIAPETLAPCVLGPEEQHGPAFM